MDNIIINRTNSGKGYINLIQTLNKEGKIQASVQIDKQGKIISIFNNDLAFITVSKS